MSQYQMLHLACQWHANTLQVLKAMQNAEFEIKAHGQNGASMVHPCLLAMKNPRPLLTGVWRAITIRLQNSFGLVLTLPRFAVIIGTSGRDTATAASPADHRAGAIP